MKFETKYYAYDITVTNLGREVIPAVKAEYAIVWKESVSFSEDPVSYSNFTSTKNDFSVKGNSSFPQLVYNRSESITTEPVEINSIIYDGNEHYREDLLLGVLVNVTLADGTKVKEYLSAGAGGKELTWELASAMPDKPGVVTVRADDDMDGEKYNLQLSKGQSEEGPINVVGKRITIRATVSPDVKSPDGVIVAIGGDQLGISLYLKDRQVYACVRNKLDIKWVAKPAPLGDFEAEVVLNGPGLALAINDGSPAKRDDVSLFEAVSTEGVDIGQDSGTPAGEYEGTFGFTGDIDDVRILIRE